MTTPQGPADWSYGAGQPQAGQPEQPFASQPFASQPEQPYGSQPFASQPSGNQPYVEPPIAGMPYNAQPSTEAQPYYPPASPQQFQPGPYQQPYPYPYARPQSTNGLAIASMVLGILWVYWIGSILALVFGYVARDQIKRSGQAGDGMAIAGIVLGWVGIGFLILGLAFWSSVWW